MSTNSLAVIFIPEPCLQSWDEMPVAENGRFCGHCSHLVIDFTQMSDVALLDYLKNNEWKCGQFKSGQLHRNIAADVVGTKRSRLKWLAGILLLFSQAKMVEAQKKHLATTTISPGQNSADASPADSTKQEKVRSVIRDRRATQKRDVLVKGHFKGFIRPAKKKICWQKLKFWQ